MYLSITYNYRMAKDETILKLGYIIKFARSKKEITQEQLVELSGVSKSTIANLECGRGNPTFLNIYKLAKVLDIDLGALNNFQL